MINKNDDLLYIEKCFMSIKNKVAVNDKLFGIQSIQKLHHFQKSFVFVLIHEITVLVFGCNVEIFHKPVDRLVARRRVRRFKRSKAYGRIVGFQIIFLLYPFAHFDKADRRGRLYVLPSRILPFLISDICVQIVFSCYDRAVREQFVSLCLVRLHVFRRVEVTGHTIKHTVGRIEIFGDIRIDFIHQTGRPTLGKLVDRINVFLFCKLYAFCAVCQNGDNVGQFVACDQRIKLRTVVVNRRHKVDGNARFFLD